MRSRPRLVVLRALGLGDYLTGIPALRALARAFPDHRRFLAAPGGLAGLVGHVGLVDAVVHTPGLVSLAPELHGARDRRRPSRPWSREPEPPAGLPTSPADLLRPCPGAGHRRCAALAARRARGLPVVPDVVRDRDPRRSPPPGHRGAAAPGGQPGARSHHRPPRCGQPGSVLAPDRWAAVARAEVAAGRRVLVTGYRSEAGLAGQVAAMAGLDPDAVLAGRTDLLELAAVVTASDRVVSGDTGVAHLATALGTSSVVLFGPVSPAHWGPPPDRPWHRALWAGRTGDPHGQRVDPGLLALSVDDVLAALDGLPSRVASHR